VTTSLGVYAAGLALDGAFALEDSPKRVKLRASQLRCVPSPPNGHQLHHPSLIPPVTGNTVHAAFYYTRTTDTSLFDILPPQWSGENGSADAVSLSSLTHPTPPASH
jgi:hypothetical protein